MVAAALVLSAVPASAHATPDPIRIMLAGDSITQGSEGDWTWRYRLWNHLAATTSIDFVGPHTTLLGGSTEYADPAFDVDHSAVWAISCAEQAQTIRGTAQTYRPDVVVALLGINDLVGFQLTPEQIGQSTSLYIDEVRAANPEATVVVGRLPWPWVDGAAQTSALIAAVAASKTTPESPVVMADIPNLDRATETIDIVHPGATAELKIAAAVADALAGVGIGTPFPRPLPAVANIPRNPPHLTATAEDGSVLLRWSNPPGATRERVWMRDTTTGTDWQALPLTVSDTQWRVGPLANRHSYEFRLQPAKKDLFSEVVSNTVVAKPMPNAVQGLRVAPQRHGLQLKWLATAAGNYQVRWGRHRTTTTATALTLRHLTAGKTYRITVRSGETSATTRGVPTGPVAAAPKKLRLNGQRLSWRASHHATRYQILRKSGTKWRSTGWTRGTHFTVRAPGTFSVRSWHQQLPGGRSVVR